MHSITETVEKGSVGSFQHNAELHPSFGRLLEEFVGKHLKYYNIFPTTVDFPRKLIKFPK